MEVDHDPVRKADLIDMTIYSCYTDTVTLRKLQKILELQRSARTILQEPDEAKVSRPVLKTRGV
jgi:hypothetical protein